MLFSPRQSQKAKCPRRPCAARRTFPKRNSCRPQLELLEERNLLAVSAWYYDQATAATVDAAGNLYVAGGFRGWVDFDPGAGQTWLQGPDPTTASSTKTPFLARYSPDGALTWVKTLSDVDPWV